MREDIKPLKGNMQIKKTSQNHYGFTDIKRTLAWETTVKKIFPTSVFERVWQSCCLQHVYIPRNRPCKQQQDITICPALVLWGNPSHRGWHEMDLAAPYMYLPEISGVMGSSSGSAGETEAHICFLWSLGTSLRNPPSEIISYGSN